MTKSLLQLLFITTILFSTLCKATSTESKSVRGHDTIFFDLVQNDINGKTVDFDRFVGYSTIVAFNVGKKGQDCNDVDKILHGFYQIHKLFHYGVEFVIVPDSAERVKACSNVFQELLSDNGVNYVLIEPVHQKDGDHRPHAVFDYMKKLFHPMRILGKDKMYFLVNPEGDVQLYFDVTVSQLKGLLHDNLRYLEKLKTEF